MQAALELLRRYGQVFRATWNVRHQLDWQPRLSHEQAFLPANLEIIETPVHPAPKWAMRTIVALALLAILLCIVGQLDIVATAKGKLIPTVRVKLIQPAITGVVKKILVQDGQRVVAGQLLMELDPTQAAADSDKAKSAKIEAALTAARCRALLEAQELGHPAFVKSVPDATDAELEEAQHFADGLLHEYQDKVASARAELTRREAELESTRQEIAKLEATAPLARQQADDYRNLSVDNYVAKHEYLDKEQAALEQEHELKAQRSHSVELGAAIAQQHADISATTSQFRREQLDSLDKATQLLAQNRDDETKAVTRQKLMSLTAPVAGTVQQLAVHTIGGVVTAAQSIMEVVPDDTLEAEVNVENKDVGFVKVGQQAIVKVEAFPYTRYGYLTGTVSSVSNDSVSSKQDGKQSASFVARIHIAKNTLRANGELVSLTPGMTVTGEIRTGKRSVAHYFLDPLVETAQESMRER